uniref:Uncharacterized protein n=1 Tax=Anopheles albimanus TaxID=7167 RepID=A0A182FK35_ANOAL
AAAAGAASTTTVRTKTTRRSASSEEQYSATTSQPPTSPSSSLLSRRRRPTAPSSGYLSKLANANRLATATVTSSGEQSTIGTVTTTTASATITTTASKFSRPKPAGAGSLRRKYGGGVRTGSNTGATSTSSGDSVTPQPDPIEPTTRATNTLFRRRNNASPLTRTTTTTTVASAESVTSSSVSDKFFGKSKYRPASNLNSVKLTAPAAPVSDADQHIEPSIRQNSKLFNNDNDEETKANARFQQIGEPSRVSMEQELLLDAITTISRAPLPLTSTTTTRNNVEPATFERTTEHQDAVHVEQQFPAKPNQRATTHKYNITHQYPYPLGYTEPLTISTSTRRSRKFSPRGELPTAQLATRRSWGFISLSFAEKLIQQPRIATQSQSYYQQAEYKHGQEVGPRHYSHPVATATIHPRQDILPAVPRKTKPPAAGVYDGPYESGRKHQDDIAGRTRTSPIDYDYYDDDNARVIGKSTSQVKVIMHGPGIIECLDQGNFPHPLSCKKFISCAKMEIGGVIGWEYICPKGLSYDPVGGICNWSAGLGCKD